MLNDRRGQVRTPAAQLREGLTQLENRVGKLEHSTREELLDILPLFDHAFALLTDLQAQGAAFPGEQARFESATATFRRKSKKFLRIIGGTATLAHARQAQSPDAARWWWFMDAWHVEQQRAGLRRTLKWLGIAAAALAVLAGLYVAFLRPDKATREQLRHQSAAERMVEAGDYANALAEVNAALMVKPAEVELYVFKGVLEAQLGQTRESELSFIRAQDLAESREAFWLERSQTYLLLGLPERTLADADAVLAENANSAYAHFLKARAYEFQGALSEADRSYTQASELAAAAGQTELEAMIRVEQAYLMQRMMAQTP